MPKKKKGSLLQAKILQKSCILSEEDQGYNQYHDEISAIEIPEDRLREMGYVKKKKFKRHC